MTRRRISFLGLRVLQVAMVTGCAMGLLAGCSSRLHTTVVSGSEEQKLQVAQVDPEPMVAEEVTVQPIQEVIPAVPAMDIPVEEPARPVIRHESGSEIFSTSRTPDVPSEISSFSEAPTSAPGDEPSMPSMAAEIEPSISSPSPGIPAIAVEPELPALPSLRQDAGISPSQEVPLAIVTTPEVSQPKESAQVPTMETPPLAAQEPVQVAKVMPQEAAKSEIITENLSAALSDIYFDYDRFSIREDAALLLKSNAQLLSATLAEKAIVIEGHCDARGTQSYNMILGEARANAIKAFLEDLGISGEKLQVVSYGKDKPFCMEQTEECWQENRRGHFVIK